MKTHVHAAVAQQQHAGEQQSPSGQCPEPCRLPWRLHRRHLSQSLRPAAAHSLRVKVHAICTHHHPAADVQSLPISLCRTAITDMQHACSCSIMSPAGHMTHTCRLACGRDVPVEPPTSFDLVQGACLARGIGRGAGGLALHIRGGALCLAGRIVSSTGDLVQNAAQVGGSILSLRSRMAHVTLHNQCRHASRCLTVSAAVMSTCMCSKYCSPQVCQDPYVIDAAVDRHHQRSCMHL